MSKVYVVTASDCSPKVFSTARKAVVYVQIEFGDYLLGGDVRFDNVQTKELVENLKKESTIGGSDYFDQDSFEINICEIQ